MEEAEKIQILLEEYKTLRSEILQRHSGFIQVCTVAGTAFVAVLGVSVVNKTLIGGILMTIALIALVAAAILLHDHDSRLIASRLVEIEKEINRRAQETLLNWESSRAILSIDFDDRMRRILARIRPKFDRKDTR